VIETLGSGLAGPSGIAVDGSGNVFVAEHYNSTVTEIVAVNGSIPASNPTILSLGGGFYEPTGVAVDGSGNVFVSDWHSNVKEIPASCIAGANNASCVLTLGGGFSYPDGAAADGSGNVFVADTGSSAVKEIPASCIAEANNALCVLMLGGGFSGPTGVVVDGSGNVYVADSGNNEVKEIPASCIAGANNASCVLTLGSGFSFPYGVAVDSSDNVYVSEELYEVVKEIATAGGNFGTVSLGSSLGLAAPFTFDSSGKLGGVNVLPNEKGANPGLDFTRVPAGVTDCVTNQTYIGGDTCNVGVLFSPQHPGLRTGAVQLLDSGGNVIATARLKGIGQGPQVVFSPSTISTLGSFHDPWGVTVDGSGNVYVADLGNNLVKEMPAGCASPACVTTLGGGFSGPEGVAVDGTGNVYIADNGNSAVKEMPAGCASSACVTTLVGGFMGLSGVAVDGNGNVYVADPMANTAFELPAGCASFACARTLGGGFFTAFGITVDGSGNVYVADSGNGEVKEMPAGCASSACVTTLGGGFGSPYGVAVDGSGNVYVADTGEKAVKEMPTGCASSACVTALGGGFSGPAGVAVDGSGNVYVADDVDDTGKGALKEILRASPPNLSFASTEVGRTSSDSPQAVTLQNIGNAPLIFPLPSAGKNPSVSTNFLWDSSSTCEQTGPSSFTAFSLAEGTTCTVAVDFAPTAVGTNSGSVALTDNSGNATNAAQSIPLSGTGLVPVSLNSPEPGSTLTSASQLFQWSSTLPAVTHFEFKLGTTGPGATDVYNGGPTTATSVTVNKIPTNGTTLYARLYYVLSGVWKSIEYTYTESGSPVLPFLATPTPSTTMPAGSTVQFSWNPGKGATAFEFKLSAKAAGLSEIYNGGETTATSVPVSGIPQNPGKKLYATLYYAIDHAWHELHYTYTQH
jgi:sugar lactone lactonase YvrE